MGWTVEHSTRDEVVRQQAGPYTTQSGAQVTAIKNARYGCEDWFLFAVSRNGKIVKKLIAVTVWDGNAHKELDEAVGPYYYGCPVEWLDEVPVPAGPYAAQWRAKVRERAAKIHQHIRGGKNACICQ
jgi:hypothetical protein